MRVESARIDHLATEVGELVVAANGLAHVARLAERADPELAAALRAVQADIDRISGALHRAVAGIRLVSLAPTLRQLPRLVREIATATGKPVHFEMRGDSVEVDKQIADGLFEPLLHIVRNAVDHGLEDIAARAAAGKPPTGRIVLTASRQGDEVVVAVRDDGAGIDAAHVRDVAVARGVIARGGADELSDIQAQRLILMPGFSTAETITDLSGRGVGMDAV
jgi:two-component system chemotaxis sensor kinase CheA